MYTPKCSAAVCNRKASKVLSLNFTGPVSGEACYREWIYCDYHIGYFQESLLSKSFDKVRITPL